MLQLREHTVLMEDIMLTSFKMYERIISETGVLEVRQTTKHTGLVDATYRCHRNDQPGGHPFVTPVTRGCQIV